MPIPDMDFPKSYWLNHMAIAILSGLSVLLKIINSFIRKYTNLEMPVELASWRTVNKQLLCIYETELAELTG